MRLSTLEIKGFKSFAERTIINFNEDVIGIVGPNGCGKSNIVDAMRWVLGEQKSKELRLEKMSNVIFNGSKKRRQSGVAEVSLTFENTKNILPTEFGNVKITRVLFRSGESEYKINGVTCRLKDITNLFLDTGIGSNSYAIIALNMVEDLLTDRDNSRRRLFEQAAGISKYKTRKRETISKLKSTSDDLERVEDLLFEIEGNLKRLEKEAKRAKKYLELKETYKQLSLDLAIHQINDYKARYKKLSAELEREQDKLRQLETQVRQREAALEKYKRAHLDKEQKVAEEQKKLNAIVGHIQKEENDKKLSHQKITYVEQRKNNLKSNIKEYQEQLAHNAEELEYYRGEINLEKDIEETLETQLMNAKIALDEIRDKHRSLKKSLDDFIEQQKIIDRDIFNVEKKQAINQSKIENINRNVQRNQSEIQKRQAELATIDTQIQENQSEQAIHQQQIEQLEAEEVRIQENIRTTSEDIETSKGEISKINRKLDATRNEYQLTKSLVENLEGFPESIKYLSKKSTWSAKAPLLSDLIYCQEAYRVAIEAFLEPFLNYYVVANQTEAIEAIGLLSTSKKGKANFFLLDAFDAMTFDDVNATVPDGAVAAMSAVKVDAPYQKLCEYLLRRVWVVDEEQATAAFKLADPKTTRAILSRKGAFIQRAYSISGGSVGTFEGKRIGRKKNLEVLEQKIQTFKNQVNTLHEQQQKQQRGLEHLKKSTKKQIIAKAKRQLEGVSRELISLKTRSENFQSFLNEATNDQTRQQQAIATIQKDNESLAVALAEKKEAAEALREEIAQQDSSYRNIADELNRASEDYNGKNIQFVRQQNKINALQKEINFCKKKATELNAKLDIDQRHLQKADQELDEVTLRVIEIEKLLEDLYAQKSDQQAYVRHAEEVYQAARGDISEAEQEIRKINRQATNLQQGIQDLRVKFSGLKLEFNTISERLRIEFDLSVNEIINEQIQSEYSPTELQERVEKIKKRLNNYGEINAMAIEAFNEMKERYDFITDQKNDLVAAKDSLMTTIKEIETVATERFMTAFDKVQVNFKQVFRSLFMKDDDCDLVLSAPDNPLESHINIVAKPKGKRPQSINQLSGGEKTLTATALLFALYLLKPAPFCVFDEVDAPLDDANIGKFNKIIKEFSADSQFIIVTHNKQTMSAVDIIYGVTNTDGISKVVPVDFRNLN